MCKGQAEDEVFTLEAEEVANSIMYSSKPVEVRV